MSPELLTDLRSKKDCVYNTAEQIRQKPRIPIENRISHLLPTLTTEPSMEWHTTTEITSVVGLRAIDVRLISEEMGIESVSERIPGISHEVTYYQPLAAELISEEMDWRSRYEATRNYINYSEIAELVNKHEKWVAVNIKKLGIQPREKQPGDNNANHYHHSVALLLRETILSTPLEDDWLNVTDLENILRSDPVTIRGLIDELGIRGQKRCFSQNGRIFTYYPPDTADIIRQFNEQRSADGWMTANYIAENIDSRSEEWVSRRLSTVYKQDGQPKLDANGAQRIHYPPHVLLELINEAADIDRHKQTGDYVSVDRIARELGHYATWVTRRLPYVPSKGEERINARNRVLNYYPPSIIDELKELPDDILHPLNEDWFTVSSLRRLMPNKSRVWIQNRLKNHQDKTTTMKDMQGVDRKYYPRETMIDLVIEAGLDPPETEAQK